MEPKTLLDTDVLSGLMRKTPTAFNRARAEEIVGRSMMPATARIDALHVALGALAGVQYLLTQNCTHIANARELPRIYRLLDELGLSGMLICTPIEFLGGNADDT